MVSGSVTIALASYLQKRRLITCGQGCERRFLPRTRHGHEKGGPGSLRGVKPDFAAMSFDDPLHHRESHALAFRYSGMQPLERLKDLSLVGLGNTKAVVLHVKSSHFSVLPISVGLRLLCA